MINVTQMPSTNLIFKVTSLVSPLEMANAYVLILYNLMWGKSPSPTLTELDFFNYLVTIPQAKMSCFHVYFPSRIRKIFGNVLVEGFGLLSSITAKFYWFILFFTSFATSFQLHKMFFWTEHKEAHCLRNLSDNENFLLLFFIFWYTFWAPIRFERYNYWSGYDPDSYKKIKKVKEENH